MNALSQVAALSDREETESAGRKAALALVDDIRQSGATFKLGYAVKAMIHLGSFGAYEIGFFQQVAEAVI